MKAKVAKGGTIHIQHSMFSTDERDEDLEVVSKSDTWSQQVTLDALEKAITAQLKAGGDAGDAKALTNGGDEVYIGDADIAPYKPSEVIPSLIGKITERLRVEAERAAGRDPYADDYLIEYWEAFDGVWSCLKFGEEPADMQFTCYHEDETRTIKLSECKFTGLDHTPNFEQLLQDVRLQARKMGAVFPVTDSTPAEFIPQPPKHPIDAGIAYEVVLDAMRNEVEDPMDVKVTDPEGVEVDLAYCTLIANDGGEMSHSALKLAVELHFQDEKAYLAKEMGGLPKPDWSM